MIKILTLIIAMVLPLPSLAAVVLSPSTPGYNSSAGRYIAPSGNFTMAPTNDAYIPKSIVNVGGKPIQVSASMRFAANAATYAKTAMKLNPYKIAGTLAAMWLLEQGLEWINEQWTKSAQTQTFVSGTGECSQGSGTQITLETCRNNVYAYWAGWPPAGMTDNGGNISISVSNPRDGSIVQNAGIWYSSGTCPAGQTKFNGQCTGSQSLPVNDADWDALPSPIPVIAPEMPYAPYMPDGAPVSPPEFAPADVPVGEPYTRPDGSTAQQRARISPAGEGQVTVDTYDLPLTDPAGNPVANPTPQDTPEPAQDPCTDNPDRIGCMNAGTDEFKAREKTVAFEFTPEASVLTAQCPAPIQVLGHSISYQPACDAMGMIKPLVIGMASIMAAYILIGAFRGGN